jgi:hypothetical protein
VTATSPEGSLTLSRVTRPDLIPPDAWRAVELLGGEAPLEAWKTPQGYLLLTNLRCVALWRKGELFAPHYWRSGPEFFFYNLKPPRVLLGRFVELEEEFEENGWVGRFLVHDPEGVAAAVRAQMESGRQAWRERRAHAEELVRDRQRLRAERAAGGRRRTVLIRCSFCGNLADVSLRRCPSCGAALE